MEKSRVFRVVLEALLSSSFRLDVAAADDLDGVTIRRTRWYVNEQRVVLLDFVHSYRYRSLFYQLKYLLTLQRITDRRHRCK